MSEFDGPAELPAEISGIPAEIDRLKAEQVARAAQTGERRLELEARLLRLAEIEHYSKDFSGTSPAEAFSDGSQQLCDEFLARMQDIGYPLSLTVVSAEKTRRKQPKTWRAYPIGRAWSARDQDPAEPFLTVYLTEDGRLRTITGCTIPPNFDVSAGRVMTARRLFAADDGSEYDLIDRRTWISSTLQEKLDGISRAADLARIAFNTI